MPKILFLAQFAPTDGKVLVPPQTSEEEFYASTYHQKIIDVLTKGNYDFDTASDVNYLIRNHDKYQLVWSVYNRLGFRNSEIFVQSLCEFYNIEYIGATPNVRALVEDKSMSKQLAEHLGIKTAPWIVASKEYPLPHIPPFPGPYFVKPRFGSASMNIDESSFCQTWEDAIRKTEDYFSHRIDVIVEKYIDGLCYGVSILNSLEGQILIAPPHYTVSNKIGNIMTYSQKRFAEEGMSRYTSSDTSINTQLQHLSKKYFKEMQPCDYARVDFILEADSYIPYFLEVNVLMNLGIRGGFVNSFLENHFKTYDELIDYILRLGLSRVKR
ncbi:MAG: ATP-grasp domain-containing protein [Butyrivibrio sp.]|nr:ATP-grasp domain-containing protein [Butyrivibrio sp.]